MVQYFLWIISMLCLVLISTAIVKVEGLSGAVYLLCPVSVPDLVCLHLLSCVHPGRTIGSRVIMARQAFCKITTWTNALRQPMITRAENDSVYPHPARRLASRRHPGSGWAARRSASVWCSMLAAIAFPSLRIMTPKLKMNKRARTRLDYNLTACVICSLEIICWHICRANNCCGAL